MATEVANKPASPMGQAKPTAPNQPTVAVVVSSPGRPAGKSYIPARELALAAEIKALKDAKKDATIKTTELNELQFRRLCVRRVENVLNQLRMLKSLSRLKPSDEYREKVLVAIDEAANALSVAWKGTAETKTGFQL